MNLSSDHDLYLFHTKSVWNKNRFTSQTVSARLEQIRTDRTDYRLSPIKACSNGLEQIPRKIPPFPKLKMMNLFLGFRTDIRGRNEAKQTRLEPLSMLQKLGASIGHIVHGLSLENCLSRRLFGHLRNYRYK
jgi:hypothetical protein